MTDKETRFPDLTTKSDTVERSFTRAENEKAWRAWLGCSRDFFLTGCVFILISVPGSANRVTLGLRCPLYNRSRAQAGKRGRDQYTKIKRVFVVFSRSIIFVITSKSIVSVSTSSCCDLSSSALFLSHSASIACLFSVSVILLYPPYQICVICWPFRLAWPSLEINH
jgi:hypothetical protein